METTGIIIGSIVGIFLIIWGISKIPKTKYMTNEEIIVEVKKCKGAGLEPSQILNGYNLKVVRVQCNIKD